MSCPLAVHSTCLRRKVKAARFFVFCFGLLDFWLEICTLKKRTANGEKSYQTTSVAVGGKSDTPAVKCVQVRAMAKRSGGMNGRQMFVVGFERIGLVASHFVFGVYFFFFFLFFSSFAFRSSVSADACASPFFFFSFYFLPCKRPLNKRRPSNQT